MSSGGGDLRHRTLSSLVLIPLVLGLTYVGGVPFLALWLVAGCAILYEWAGIARLGNVRIWLAIGALTLIAAGALVFIGDRGLAFTVVLLGAAACAFAVPRQSALAVAGVIVAAAAALPVVALRGGDDLGLLAVLFIYAVVWATDILAYFSGRSLGGPKLWPRVSPNKTWSGAIGGMVAGMAAGLAVAAGGGLASLLPLAALALLLSVTSQAGDLAESAAKRAFQVKDAGCLIPGHGGFLDRLDGFAAAALLAVAVAELRGVATPAAGLLLW